MSPMFEPIHDLAQHGRAHAPALLAGFDDPHAELLSMVWGPRFDREHAMALWAKLSRQRPADALPLLPALLAAADRFDDLAVASQHRLRRLIVRHQAGAERAAMSATLVSE